MQYSYICTYTYLTFNLIIIIMSISRPDNIKDKKKEWNEKRKEKESKSYNDDK